MIVEIDPASPLPPYEQIRQQVAALVGSGELPVSARLPSIRQLSADLGLAAGTVARAYRELEAAGYLKSRVGQGTVVAGRPGLPAAERRRRLADAARAYASAVRQLGVEPASALDAVRHELDQHPGRSPGPAAP
ncbi:MAG TPA: GntR family transcriptional regulator [Mycobacteriales bacterium]|nr:GntR family transcriptional regulator [Mycobacteriales bacterium]